MTIFVVSSLGGKGLQLKNWSNFLVASKYAASASLPPFYEPAITQYSNISRNSRSPGNITPFLATMNHL
jgi:hypothetical protein